MDVEQEILKRCTTFHSCIGSFMAIFEENIARTEEEDGERWNVECGWMRIE